MSKISVIVPIYNTDMLLRKCVESIINQTYTNIEIILVDDGSVDNSSKICDEYVRQDKRIRVIHKVNGGVSSARNTGIEVSTGNFVTFVDSDDYVNRNFLKDLYDSIVSTGSDISICQIRYTYSYNCEDGSNNDNSVCGVLSGFETAQEMLYMRSISNGVLAKLFRLEQLDNLRFSINTTYAEDLEYSYKMITNANKVVISNSNQYNYYQRPSSAMHIGFSPKRMDGLYVTSKILVDAEQNHVELVKPAQLRHFMEAYTILRCIIKANMCNSQYFLECVSVIKALRIKVAMDNKSLLRHRIIALLSIINPIFPGRLIQYKNNLEDVLR